MNGRTRQGEHPAGCKPARAGAPAVDGFAQYVVERWKMSDVAGATLFRPQLFIDGAWVPAAQGGVIEVCSPATEEIVGTVGEAGPADIDRAVKAARRSFEDGAWRCMAPADRAEVLDRAADHLEARLDELARLMTAELGCTLAFARNAHVPGPIRHLRYYAELIRNYGWIEPRSDGVNSSLVVSEPVGVVGAISPWNGPLSGIVLKAAPALAAGCSVVAKPSPEAPLSSIALADALASAGLPPGVFNLVPGGGEAGEHLVRHPAVDKIAFTGSTAVGKRIMALCSERVARVTLELGGKSAAIVLDDADVAQVARTLPPMLVAVNGQICIAQSRVFVPRRRLADFTDALCQTMAGFKVGDPFDAATDIGPLISERQRVRVEGYVRSAEEQGARIATGGKRPGDLARGHYFEPTVLTGVENAMAVAREEVFGPVMAVLAYDDPADAVRMANDSVYGLAGSVWSSDPERALSIGRQMKTGMVSINGCRQAWGTPFGGSKQSGLGREMGPEGLKSFIELKSIAIPHRG